MEGTPVDYEEIGGHLGMHVFRGRDRIRKIALHVPNNQGVDAWDENVKALMNEARLLEHLSGSHVAPELYARGEDWIEQEDLGVSEPPQDMELLRRRMVRMVATP